MIDQTSAMSSPDGGLDIWDICLPESGGLD